MQEYISLTLAQPSWGTWLLALPCIVMIPLVPFALKARFNHHSKDSQWEVDGVSGWAKQLVATGLYSLMVYFTWAPLTVSIIETMGWAMAPLAGLGWGLFMWGPLVVFAVMLRKPEMFPLVADIHLPGKVGDAARQAHARMASNSDSFFDGAA